MKRKTYRILSMIPVVGAFVKIHCDGTYILNGSYVKEDSANGEDGGWLKGVNDSLNQYLKDHPDEYPTKQLIKKISAEWVNQHKD